MKHIKEFFVNSFFTYFAIELVEEILEELIVAEVSGLILKFMSTFLFVSLSTGAKMGFKAVIKRITYKEGNDKVAKVKKFFTWLWCNKKTIIGSLFSIVSGVITAIAINGEAFGAMPALCLWGFNVTPIIAGLLVTAGLEVGVIGKGFETIKQFTDRIAILKEQKENKAIQKEAKKQIANDEKIANQTQAEQEKARAKAELEAKIKAEKERLDAEHKAKVEAAKLELLKEKNAQVETKAE